MKNNFFILAGFLLVMVLLLNIHLVAAEVISCNPIIKLVSQDPDPAVPNDYMRVIFEITGLGNCEGFAVKLNPEYPFSLDLDSSNIQTIEGNPYASDYKNTWMIPYKIRIDKDAFDGDYNLKLQYHEGSSESFKDYVEKGFNVTIKNSLTQFDAVIQESTGSEVSIAIANIGKYTANSVVVRIPEQESFSASGTDGQMVGNLESGDYTVVGFTILQKGTASRTISKTNTPANSQAVSNKLKFDIYYTDNIGERRVVNMELPLSTGNNSMSGAGAFSGRTTQTTSSWYSSWINWIIILGILIVLYVLFKKYPKKTKELLYKIRNLFKKKSSQEFVHSNKKVPDWVRNAKEKEKNK